ncbi:putative acetyltransferase EpsM [mine drainage metagenome]|jgi:sugar O-acyltransferase (sialic acid O-acetyltransferase NeuD family)|uniref:Putative acetyltransferase EpsM n=1 Tax=mine drainage metagenome TaxID=410659 RepID=A0A1J5QQC3_9ZZZZ
MPGDTLLIVFGAGGHGRVAADAALASSVWRGVVASDRDDALWGSELLPGVPVLSPAALPDLRGPLAVHVAIGDNAKRRAEAQAWAALAPLASVVHPSAAIAASAAIGAGCLLAAQCVVAPLARLGTGVIVNHGAIVDHDCRIDPWTHVAPGARLGGAVQVGEGALLGSGCTVLPGLRVGAGAVLGAGAVAARDVPDAQCWAGVPAAPLRRR